MRLRIADAGIKEIIIIPTPVRSGGYAFHKSYKAAKEVMEELAYMMSRNKA